MEVENSIVVNSMDTNHKLKLLQPSLHYILHKLRINETIEKPQEDKPIFIEVFDSNDGQEEAENWHDNFEDTSRKKKLYQPMSNYCHRNWLFIPLIALARFNIGAKNT